MQTYDGVELTLVEKMEAAMKMVTPSTVVAMTVTQEQTAQKVKPQISKMVQLYSCLSYFIQQESES